jgi:hypothetical protein
MIKKVPEEKLQFLLRHRIGEKSPSPKSIYLFQSFKNFSIPWSVKGCINDSINTL